MPRVYYRRPPIERWFDRVKINHENGCWELDSSLNKSGYATINDRELGRPILAHRLLYQHFIGPLMGLCVLHKCDNPKCSNPDHLFLGTRSENAEDKISKGRQSKGESSGLNKLTEKDIQLIFEMRRNGCRQPEIAKAFRVTQSAISRVLNGKRWKHVPPVLRIPMSCL